MILMTVNYIFYLFSLSTDTNSFVKKINDRYFLKNNFQINEQ